MFQLSEAARQQFAQAILPRGTSTFMPITADPRATYTNPYAGQSNPQAGNLGMGGGGPNRYDYTQPGSGLWSIGIDRSSPTAINDVISWYQRQDPSTRAAIGAIGGRNVNDPVGLLNTIDQRQRDVARQITKTNGFFDSTFGKVLSFAAPMGLGLISAPLGIAASTAIGGARGGVPGAVLGGLGAAVAPALKFPTVPDIVRAPGLAATNVARQFANPMTAGRQIASLGIGAANPRRR